MKYVLLNYVNAETAGERRPGQMHPAIAAVLERPDVSGWVRLHPAESATTVRLESRKVLLTDGPFVDSKEVLAGLILVEADNLDGALAVAADLQEISTVSAHPNARARPVKNVVHRPGRHQHHGDAHLAAGLWGRQGRGLGVDGGAEAEHPVGVLMRGAGKSREEARFCLTRNG